MSHLSAEVCIQRLAAGRGHGYRLAAATASTARARHWQWSSLLNVNDDRSAQCDEPLDGSRGEARSLIKLECISVSVMCADAELLSCAETLVYRDDNIEECDRLVVDSGRRQIIVGARCASAPLLLTPYDIR